jgi:hypothetical protein
MSVIFFMDSLGMFVFPVVFMLESVGYVLLIHSYDEMRQ